MQKHIVVAGSSNTDLIVKVPRIPRPGETVIEGRFSSALGGKGANQAVAASRAGGKVSFVGRVGKDMFGEKAVRGLVEDRIDVKRVFRDEELSSGVAFIFVDEQGENSIAVASGANLNLSPEDLKSARDTISQAYCMLLQLEVPLNTVEAAAQMGNENGMYVILDPAPAAALPESLLKNVSIITPNENEAEVLTGIRVTGEASAESASQVLHSRGVESVLITRGAAGVFVSAAGGSGTVPAFDVEAEDTTAAGDVFNGALALALSENQPLFEAVRFASAASALSVTKLGAQSSAPLRSAIDSFLKGVEG